MFAKLSALVGSGPVFPYTLGREFGTAWGSWKHFEGVAKEDESAVSVFRISSASKSDPKLQAARNGVRRLKMLRHPNVLAFKYTAELEERGETVIYMVTEPVIPLVDVLDTLDVTGTARDEYVAMGLYHISKAVSFINNDCKLIHGNVCMRTVVVTEQLDWRLHGFDLLSEHVAPATGDWALSASSWLVGAQYKSAEVAKADWAAVAQSPPWAVDAWGLGCLMQEAFSGVELSRTEDLRNLDPIPKPVAQDYQRLLASAPSKRLNPARLAESSVLKNKLVDTIAFLENLAVKDSAEKDLFFKRLPSAIPALPVPVAQRKLLPMLAGALEFGGAPAVALAALLQIGKTLEAEDFTKRVVPALSKLFTSTDRAIRRSLLESIDTYGQHLSQTTVEEQIYPQVATGFGDSNAYLRELTLKSMLVLAPKLTQRTINQSLLKHLAKLQVDEEAPIRANTTILLGNLSTHLSESTCKRVLLNAFTRALKDTFPPARIAGLKAMLATAHLHDANEAANRVLPAVAPLGVDAVQEVRHTALQVLISFTKLLQDHSRTLDDQAQASGTGAKDLAQASTAGGWSVGGLGGSLGWAMSSIRPTTTSSAPTRANSSTADAVSTERPPSASSMPSAAPEPPSHSAPATSSADAADGWGNDDLDLGEPLENEETEARKQLSRLTTSQAAPAASTSGRKADTDGWKDDNDTWEDMDGGNSQSSVQSHTSAGSATARHVPARPPAGRGTGPRRGSRTGSRPGGMKLGAQKLKPKPEEAFEF